MHPIVATRVRIGTSLTVGEHTLRLRREKAAGRAPSSSSLHAPCRETSIHNLRTTGAGFRIHGFDSSAPGQRHHQILPV